ncbi:MAG: hypothetical protein F4Y05_03345 [Acidimicrobiaceae bacterium]|nr:hypothetical protein [Acidimicrobiaceae bacterium]MYE08620.1 hypothetical protein [Acidimicrobiaceae bacterium]MYI36918.1 hypothetical protein [Acidimicrobiaceae bacterium]
MATAPTTGEAPQPAPAGDKMWSRIARSARRSATTILRSAQTGLRSAAATRPRRRIRLIDVLRVLGLARRAVPRPVVGPKAYPQWWQRLLALVVLIALVVGIGFALAALVGLLVVVAGFLLEQAIS